MSTFIFARALLVFLSLQATAIPYKGDRCIVNSGFIYQPADVQFPSCHASTLAETGKGLAAAWFGGTAEKNPDVGVWVSRYSQGKWSKPVEAANGIQHKAKRYPCWNPVLFNSGRQLLLFYKVGPSPSEWWGEMMTSDDEGLTWSWHSRLPEDIYGPVKNKPVMLKNGELLCPSSTENEGWRVHMEFTADYGRTWERTGPLNEREKSMIQPTVLIHPDGAIQILCRSRNSGIMTSFSKDNGRTWEEFRPAGLPNPNSGIDGVTLKDGRQLLVYNHLESGRQMLNVAISENGVKWKAAVLLENGVRGNEFSYPAVIQSSDGIVHITYTWNRKLIKHVAIDPSLIVTKDFNGGVWPEN